MGKIRTMGAGLGGSTAKNVNVNANTGGGNKKQGLSTTTNKRVQFVSNAIKTRSYGEHRNFVFCMNQLGGVGAVGGGNGSRMFGTTSDGVKDCITGPYGCEQLVREAYLEAYGREPDKSGLRTYCIAMTKRKWSKADVIADLEKNEDSLTPIYASLEGSYVMWVQSSKINFQRIKPVTIDKQGNITGTSQIGKITVISETEYSLTMDDNEELGMYGVTNVSGIKRITAAGQHNASASNSAIDAEWFDFRKGEGDEQILIFFNKDTDADGVDDYNDYFPNDSAETQDIDGDGVGDNTDDFPADSNETVDTDGDGVGDNTDDLPENPNETVDTDGDGVGDNTDTFPDDPNKNEVTVPPVITVTGGDALTIDVSVDGTYEDYGATATDEVGANVDIVVTGTVDATQIGTYTITYTATDNYGLSSTATRTVNVVDTTAPVISLSGDETVYIGVGLGNYTDAGATATDNLDGDITEDITTVNPVDTDTVGTYTVTYNVSDASGNAAKQVTRTVYVVDVFTYDFTDSGDLSGQNEFVFAQFNNPTSQGIRATDDDGREIYGANSSIFTYADDTKKNYTAHAHTKSIIRIFAPEGKTIYVNGQRTGDWVESPPTVYTLDTDTNEINDLHAWLIENVNQSPLSDDDYVQSSHGTGYGICYPLCPDEWPKPPNMTMEEEFSWSTGCSEPSADISILIYTPGEASGGGEIEELKQVPGGAFPG